MLCFRGMPDLHLGQGSVYWFAAGAGGHNLVVWSAVVCHTSTYGPNWTITVMLAEIKGCMPLSEIRHRRRSTLRTAPN